MRFLLSFLIKCLTIHSSVSYSVRYDDYRIYKLIPQSAQEVRVLRDLKEESMSEYDFLSPVRQIGEPVNIMVPPYKIRELEQVIEIIGIDGQVLTNNVQNNIDAEEEGMVDEEFGWTSYHTLDQINIWLRNLTITYPSQVKLIEVNGTYQGRNITGVKVSFSPKNKKRAIFIESNIHARECVAEYPIKITSAVSTFILNDLLTSPNVSIQELAKKHDWYFFPVFNPDGFVYSHKEDRIWRKTVVPHNVICNGADPNRNWGYLWNHGGTSASPCAMTYRGPHAFSEPSCKAMAEFILSIGDNLVAYISFHSYSQCLLLPFGHTSKHLQNYDLMYKIGLKAAESLAVRYGTKYRVGNIVETMYVVSGTSTDWVKGTLKTPIVFTYELRDTGKFGFELPADQIIPTAEETLDSIVTMFEEYYSAVEQKSNKSLN